STNMGGKEDGFEFTAPVGSFRSGASVYGVQDIVGNVWEWTSSPYKPYPGSQESDERYKKDFRVIKGGGFQSPVIYFYSASFRFPSKPQKTYEATGFRCARTP